MFLYLLETDRILTTFTQKGNWCLESLKKEGVQGSLVTVMRKNLKSGVLPLVMFALHRSKKNTSLEEQPKTQENKNFKAQLFPYLILVKAKKQETVT